MDILKAIVPNITKDFSDDNNEFNSLLELGGTYFLAREYDKSMAAYEKAIEKNPKNSGGWMGKSLSHLATTDVIGINEVDVKPFLDSAIAYADQKTMEKYLVGVTLYYSYNYASAIKLLIDHTNEAIEKKKEAQIQAVVGLATAAVGGAMASKSGNSVSKWVGAGMVAAGGGVTIKKGFDSFNLDQLSKSLYGNALAQTLVSIPVIKQSHEILKSSTGDLRHNTSVILDSWKDSVIYLFKNEKKEFVKTLKDLEDIDNLIDDERRTEIEKKVDEILYFMDMVGLDESNDFKSVMSIKKSMSSFTDKFSASDRLKFAEKKKKVNSYSFKNISLGIGLWVVASIILGLLFGPESDPELVAGGAFWIALMIVFYKIAISEKKLKSEVGLDVVEDEVNLILTEIKEVQIEKNEFDLNLLGN